MFSEIQRNYIQQLVLANKDKYPYYLAYTNSNISQGSNYDTVNFYVVISDEPITASSQYVYEISGNSKRFAVKSGSASYSYHTERVQLLAAPSEVSINNYEFVYTNANFSGASLQPDLLVTNGLQQSHFDGFSIAILIIIVSVLFYKMIRGGGGYAKI